MRNFHLYCLKIGLILFFVLVNGSLQLVCAQITRKDFRELKCKWGKEKFRRANTARFSFYMGRNQKRTILYMNLARQNGPKFIDLVSKPYIKKHPEHKEFLIKLKNKKIKRLRPSFRLWLAALPHAVISGIVGSCGHQGFDARMLMTLNFRTRGENCSYGYSKGIDITLQLLNSPPHKANILDKSYTRAAVSKFLHVKYGWNSVTDFSGP